MIDDESGLCSEGVWHNSWLGVSRVLTARKLREIGEDAEASRFIDAAFMLGESLYDMSFDGSGFRRRTSSGYWEAASAPAIEKSGEDASFYAASDEYRCASSGAAAIFFSLLAEEAEVGTPAADAATARSVEIFDAFTEAFFDTSACRFRREAGDAYNGEGESGYWRAVDQAVGCLASLRMARMGHRVAESRAAASCAADSLLGAFGYSLYATEGQPPGTYLGCAPPPPRNSWHDGLACFALLASGVLGVGGETPAGLIRAMADSYLDDDGSVSAAKVILHRPIEQRQDAGAPMQDEREVAYSSTQALWSACVRAAEVTNDRAAAAGGADVPALRTWCERTRQADSGLLPVANVYTTPRLWANTEWAAFVLLEKDIFVGAP